MYLPLLRPVYIVLSVLILTGSTLLWGRLGQEMEVIHCATYLSKEFELGS